MGNNNIISKIRAHFNIMPDKEDEQEIISQITSGISFRGANLWVLIFAIFTASLGLNVNSTAVIIGAMIAWYEGGFSAQFPALFAYNALTVGIGEAIACCVLGLLLLEVMPRIPALRGRLAVR